MVHDGRVTTLIGIAIDEGRIPGLEATLRELLPEHADAMRPLWLR